MTCADNANALAAKGEPHGQHTPIDKTEAEVPLFFGTVAEVFRNDTVWIEKCVLCSLEPDAMLAPVQQVLSAVPFKADIWRRMARLPYKSMVVTFRLEVPKSFSRELRYSRHLIEQPIEGI